MAMRLNISFNLGSIKKYASLAVPIAIVVLALIFLGVTVLQGRSLVARMERESLAVGRQIDQLVAKAVPEQQWAEEKKYQDAHEQDATQIARLGIHSSLRHLISYRIFPEPKDTSRQVFTNFGQAVRQYIENLIEQVHGRGVPTQDELQSLLGIKTSLSAGGNWNRENRDQNTQAVIDAFCRKRAEEIAVYLTPDAFAWYGFWDNYQFPGKDKAIEHCWYTQLACWIYEDVIQSIQQLNGSSTSVLDSPVKRLIAVSFQRQADYTAAIGGTFYGTSRLADSGRMGIEDRPEYVRENMPSVLGVEPWTGRTCNEDYDVVHFSVGVIVAANAVGDFMKALCGQKISPYRENFDENAPLQQGIHNSITILDSEIGPVERQEKEHELYRYGQQAVVRLTLTCEVLFSRAGYDSIMPENIREFLNPDDTNTTGGSGASRMRSPASRGTAGGR